MTFIFSLFSGNCLTFRFIDSFHFSKHGPWAGTRRKERESRFLTLCRLSVNFKSHPIRSPHLTCSRSSLQQVSSSAVTVGLQPDCSRDTVPALFNLPCVLLLLHPASFYSFPIVILSGSSLLPLSRQLWSLHLTRSRWI